MSVAVRSALGQSATVATGLDLRIALPVAIVAVGLNVLLQHNAALTPGVM